MIELCPTHSKPSGTNTSATCRQCWRWRSARCSIALQCGLLLGLFSITSLPIDHTDADIWMGAPSVLSVDLGEPIRSGNLFRLQGQPGIERAEIYLQGFSYWAKPKGGRELCMIIGSRLEEDSLGRVRELTPELRSLLTAPGNIVVDESDMDRLGIKQVGQTAEIIGMQVRVVGLTKGIRSLAGPYVFCSVTTAQQLLRGTSDQATYILARCTNRDDAPKVVESLRKEYTNLSAFTAKEFSKRSQIHWLTKTKAGIALGYAALLGLLVGAVVTAQTLRAATLASIKEFAVLRALGIRAAHGHAGGEPGVLGRHHRCRPGPAGGVHRGEHRRSLRRRRPAALVGADAGDQRHAGNGDALRSVRPASPAPGRTGDIVAVTSIGLIGLIGSISPMGT